MVRVKKRRNIGETIMCNDVPSPCSDASSVLPPLLPLLLVIIIGEDVRVSVEVGGWGMLEGVLV